MLRYFGLRPQTDDEAKATAQTEVASSPARSSLEVDDAARARLPTTPQDGRTSSYPSSLQHDKSQSAFTAPRSESSVSVMDAVRSQHPNLSVFRPSTRNVFADNSAGKVAEGMRQEDSPYSQNGEPSMSSARTALSPEERQLSPTFSLPGPSAPTTSDAPQKDKLLQSLLDPADVDLDVDSPSVRSSNSRKLHLIKPRRKAPAAFPLNEDGMEHDATDSSLPEQRSSERSSPPLSQDLPHPEQENIPPSNSFSSPATPQSHYQPLNRAAKVPHTPGSRPQGILRAPATPGTGSSVRFGFRLYDTGEESTMSASVDGENSFATHPLATSFQGSRDDEMGEESRADEDMEFDEQLVEGSLRLDDELGAENVPPGGDDVDQPETSVSPPDTAPKHASSFYSDTSFRSRQTNDGSPTVRLDAVDAAPPLQDVSISRSYADTAKAAADQAGDSPSLLSSRPLSSHLEEGESDLSNLVDASITGFPRLSSESMLPSVPEDSDTSMVMTEAADESSLLLPSSHSHSGSVGMRTPKSSAESNQSSGVDSNELSFSESFLKAEHEKMVAGLVLEDEPEEELDDADGVPKRPEEVEGDAYLDEHRASDEVSTPLNRSSSPAPQNAPTPSRAGASDASTARPADMSVGSIWHDTSFATTAWATPGWSGPSTPPGKLLSFDSPAGGTSANAGQDSSPSVQKAERRGASAAVESAAGLRSPLQDITALHSPRDSPARGRSGSIGLPDAISRSSGSPVSPRPSIRGPLPRSKPTTPSPQTPDRGLGLRLQPSPEISSRRTPDSARRTSLTTPGDHSTVSRSRYTDADTSLPLSEVFDAITELDVTHSERGTMLVERLKRAEEEARALRGTLAEVGQRSAEEQEKRELAEMELLKLNERVGRMGEEATSMCAAHQKKNEEVQALVEKLTAQLSHRSGANLETAEAETDKIRELEEALALERRQRADEQRDWQIRLAGMHQDPSTSSAHVTGEETTAQADRNREAVEEAKRLTREACERDFEIRVYVARQDATANEQRLRAELLEAQDAIRKTGERKDEGQHLHELERTVETQRLEIDLLKDQQKEHESQLIEVRQAEEARGHQLEQSREQCQEIHASLDRVQEAKDQMQVQLDGTRAELSAATEARDRLVEELEAMRDTLIASQTDEIVRLTAERDRVTRELEELRKESEAQWANAERAHDTEQTLKGEKARLEAELSNAVEKSSRADGLEEQVSRLEEDKSRLQAELEAALNLANNVDEMEERVRELEAERNSAINELQDLRDRTQETEGRLEKRIGELQTSVVKLEQERHGLLAGNDAETSALRQSVEDLSKQLQEEQRNVAALEDEKKASNVEMETLRVDFDAAAAELRDIVGLKDQLETLRTEIEDAAAAARNANDEAERLQHDLDDRKAELKAVHEELERSEQALEAARAEKRQVQEQLDATGQVHADALAKAHKEAAVVQAKFAEAQYAIAELEGQLNAARNKTESDTAPVEPEQLAAATARIDSLEASLSAARNAAESARKAQEQAEELVRQADEQRKEDLAGRGRLISAHDQLRRERDELLQSLAEVEDHVAMQERDLHTKQEALHKAQETASSALAQQDGEKVHELETELRIAQSDALARQKTHAEAAARLEECQAILSRAEEELAKFRARASFLEHEVADRGLTIVKLTKAKERLEEDNLNYGIALSAKQQELSLLKRSAGVRSAQRTPVLPTSASTSRLRVLGAMGTNVTGGAQSGSDTERKETQMVHGAQDEDEAHEGLPELVKGPSQLRAVRRRTIDPATMPRVPRTSGVPSLPTKAKMAAAPRASTAGEMPPPSVTRPLARRTSNVGPAPNANARIDKPAESASRRSSISSQTSVGTAGGDKTTTFAASTRTRASSTASTNKPTAGSATPVRRPVTRSTVAGAARPGTISRRASIASAAPSQTETETDRPLELGDLTVSDKENAGPGSAAGISHSASASRLSEVPGMESFMARRNRANGQRERRKTMVPA